MITVLVGFVAGFLAWGLGEYLLHRFAMHELYGKGIMSREHLRHHVKADWNFGGLMLLSWLGIVLVGSVLLLPLGWLTVSLPFGISLAVGWAVGYFFYEYHHAASHLKAPKGRYTTLVRHHHFHHHFGHPMSNHGVTTPFWDIVFRTREKPDVVRVPRRMAMPWLLDDAGQLRPEFADRYQLVGSERSDERLAAIDKARAYSSRPPLDDVADVTEVEAEAARHDRRVPVG